MRITRPYPRITFVGMLDGQVDTFTIELSTITCFGIDIQPVMRKSGGFKRWSKSGYLVSDSSIYRCPIQIIKDLKKSFRGAFEKPHRSHHTEIKFTSRGRCLGERKAVSWIYTVIR